MKNCDRCGMGSEKERIYRWQGIKISAVDDEGDRFDRINIIGQKRKCAGIVASFFILNCRNC